MPDIFHNLSALLIPEMHCLLHALMSNEEQKSANQHKTKID